jgi:hypothetical protein
MSFGKDAAPTSSEVTENMMRASLFTIAVVLGSSNAGAAQPDKEQPPAHAHQASAPIVLASANVHAPVTPDAQPTTAPGKHRPARITTCRCGDAQPDPDSQEQ